MITIRPRPDLRLAVAAAALFAAMHADAQSYTISFDAGDPLGGLAAGSTLANQYAAWGISFAANAFSGPSPSTGGAATWATNTNMGIVAATGTDVGTLGAPALVGGNLLHAFSGWVTENGDPSFRASFSRPVTSFSADFAGVGTFADVHLYAYAGSTLLGTATGATTGQFTLALSGTGITSVVVTPGDYNDWVGVDNIRYTIAAVPPVGAVPEPSTWAMLVAGLGGLVAWRRRSARG